MKFARILKHLEFNLIFFRVGLVWALPYPSPNEARSKSKNPSHRAPPTAVPSAAFASNFVARVRGRRRRRRRRPLSIAPCPPPPHSVHGSVSPVSSGGCGFLPPSVRCAGGCGFCFPSSACAASLVLPLLSAPFRPSGPPLLPQSEPRKHIPQRSQLSPPPPRRLDRHHAAATSTPVSGAPAATPASSRCLGTPPPLCLHLENLPQLQCLPCGPASHLPSRPPREAAAAAGNTHEKDQTCPHRWSSRLGREHIDNAHPHSIP
jgi:hypothetical protein